MTLRIAGGREQAEDARSLRYAKAEQAAHEWLAVTVPPGVIADLNDMNRFGLQAVAVRLARAMEGCERDDEKPPSNECLVDAAFMLGRCLAHLEFDRGSER